MSCCFSKRLLALSVVLLIGQVASSEVGNYGSSTDVLAWWKRKHEQQDQLRSLKDVGAWTSTSSCEPGCTKMGTCYEPLGR